MGTLKARLCSSHIGQVLQLPGAVSPDVLHIASLQITLTVPEVVDTENRVTYHSYLTQAAMLRGSHSH